MILFLTEPGKVEANGIKMNYNKTLQSRGQMATGVYTNVIRQVYICTEHPGLPLPNLRISIQMTLHGTMPVMHPVFLWHS